MRLMILLAALTLSACTAKPSFQDAPLSQADLELEEFFSGRVVGYGQFQDVLGTVRQRFEVEIEGTFDGQMLTLVEDFVYVDGATERRVWTLTKTGPESWSGTAPGVIGTATGIEDGDRFNWRYTIDLPLPAADGTVDTMRVSFDDWMWLQAEDRLLNLAYMKRYGVDIGTVTIMFERAP